MMKTFEKTIGDNNYCIVPFTGTNGLELLAEFVGYAATFFKLLSSDVGLSFSLQKVLDSSLDGNAVDKLVDSFQEMLLVKDSRDRLIDFIMRLVANTSMNGKEDLSRKEVFDRVFSVNYGELFLLAKEVLAVNFFSQNFIRDLITQKTQKEKQQDLTHKSGSTK